MTHCGSQVSMRDPAEAKPLLKAAMLVTTAIAAILENAELLINLPNGVYCGYQPDRRDLVSSILSDKGGQEALQARRPGPSPRFHAHCRAQLPVPQLCPAARRWLPSTNASICCTPTRSGSF